MKEINLLPEEYIQKQNNKRKRRNNILILLCVLLILLIFYFYLYFVDDNIKKEIFNNTSKMKELNEMEEIQRQIDIEQETFENRVSILELLESQKINQDDFLKNIEWTVPSEIILENIVYNDKNHFSIEGKTRVPNSIADFMMNISKIKNVNKVILNNVQYIKDTDTDKKISIFSIQFTYKAKGGKKSDVNQ